MGPFGVCGRKFVRSRNTRVILEMSLFRLCTIRSIQIITASHGTVFSSSGLAPYLQHFPQCDFIHCWRTLIASATGGAMTIVDANVFGTNKHTILSSVFAIMRSSLTCFSIVTGLRFDMVWNVSIRCSLSTIPIGYVFTSFKLYICKFQVVFLQVSSWNRAPGDSSCS